jgi:DNA-binding MarR family transcriptional regulator
MDTDAQANRILRLLRRCEVQGDSEQIAASALAEALQVDPSTVRMAVELLEIRRCVRVLDMSNGSYTVTLTDLGRAAVGPPIRSRLGR